MYNGFECVFQGHGHLEAYSLGLCTCSFQEGHVRLIYICGDVGKCVSAGEMRFCVSTGAWETCISWSEKYVLWLCVTSLQMDELGPRIIGYVEVISYVVCWR